MDVDLSKCHRVLATVRPRHGDRKGARHHPLEGEQLDLLVGFPMGASARQPGEFAMVPTLVSCGAFDSLGLLWIESGDLHIDRVLG